MTDPDPAKAWDELHAATPPGWSVGTPSYHDDRRLQPPCP